MAVAALQRRAREARFWLMDACFPLWSEVGVGKQFFLERLDLSHKPVDSELTRVRVQARQIYLFALAARMGWKPNRAADLVALGVAALSGPCRREDGLVGKLLSTETGALQDETPDLYDTAFALFALAEASQNDATSHGVSATSQSILSALDKHMKDAENGGYAEALPRPDQRRQNPHMHLFEACLALDKTFPDNGHLARAEEIHGLFLNKFTCSPDGLLGEYFRPDWSQETGEAFDVIEPGHQLEWVWLLHTYAKRTQSDPPAAMAHLYQFACKTLDGNGRAIQSVKRDGTPVDTSRRTWPQTEALKAHLAMAERGDGDAATRAVLSFDTLMDEYLTPEGGWIDHYDAAGQVIAADMPASTGYHVALAFDELIRLYGG